MVIEGAESLALKRGLVASGGGEGDLVKLGWEIVDRMWEM